MRRPVIGITLELDDPLIPHVAVGLRAPLEEAGALVIALPRDTPEADLEQVLAMLDGIELSGGADVDPAHYGHERHHLTETVPERHDRFEISLARHALERGMPVLGICRGAQVLAVADGGTLTQDVLTLHDGAHAHTGSWEGTALEPPGDHWHDITIEPDSALAGWFAGGPHRVNSFHHQCVATVGTRLRPVARSLDGVIEATERADGAGWAVGLQWHNELMWRHDRRFLGPHHGLVAAARAYAAGR
jgi:putative glutamine amidotransferase